MPGRAPPKNENGAVTRLSSIALQLLTLLMRHSIVLGLNLERRDDEIA
jgi:hypothetical protein